MVRKGEIPVETCQRIIYARGEQLAARAIGDEALETMWSEAIDRLLSNYVEELKANANS